MWWTSTLGSTATYSYYHSRPWVELDGLLLGFLACTHIEAEMMFSKRGPCPLTVVHTMLVAVKEKNSYPS
jgi:hypothetical protein